MTAQAPEVFTLRQISPDDSVSGLSLGSPEFAPLKSFLRRDARRFHVTNAAKTYVFTANHLPKKVVAYITLLCSYIQLDVPPADMGEYKYDDYPAVKIGRLAVDQRYERKGLATQLVDLAVVITRQRVMPHVGCRFLILDAKQGSVAFYEKRGFRLLDTQHNREKPEPVMFMDVGKLPG